MPDPSRSPRPAAAGGGEAVEGVSTGAPIRKGSGISSNRAGTSPPAVQHVAVRGPAWPRIEACPV